jgi:hypothetical protein
LNGVRTVTTRPGRACVGAIMKLEAPYIVEWVAWYQASTTTRLRQLQPPLDPVDTHP